VILDPFPSKSLSFSAEDAVSDDACFTDLDPWSHECASLSCTYIIAPVYSMHASTRAFRGLCGAVYIELRVRDGASRRIPRCPLKRGVRCATGAPDDRTKELGCGLDLVRLMLVRHAMAEGRNVG